MPGKVVDVGTLFATNFVFSSVGDLHSGSAWQVTPPTKERKLKKEKMEKRRKRKNEALAVKCPEQE